MQVGITGGSGFIGRAFKDYLSLRGHEFLEYSYDLSNPDEVKQIFSRTENPEIIIHLAGRFSGNRKKIYSDNLIATHNILHEAKKHPKTHLIFTSSGAVYGNSGDNPINEKKECKPNTEYGLIKLYCEKLIEFYESSHGVNASILRLPSVYGENNNKGIIYNWLQGIAKEQKLIINGNGRQKRSLIHVDDICGALYEIMNIKVKGTFNVSSNEHYDLISLANIFKEFFDFEIYYEESNNSLESMVLDSKKLQQASNWRPQKNLKDFLRLQMNA